MLKLNAAAVEKIVEDVVFARLGLLRLSYYDGSRPDPDTGLWKVRPDVTQGQRDVSVIHLDSFFRGTHLLPIFDGDHFLPRGFHHSYTLDSFHTYFVNKCIDNLAHEMLF